MSICSLVVLIVPTVILMRTPDSRGLGEGKEEAAHRLASSLFIKLLRTTPDHESANGASDKSVKK
jgi:hypothetical protein